MRSLPWLSLLALPLGACADSDAPNPPASTAAALAAIDCSTVFCTSADQPVINGYNMFGHRNFDMIVDGWGRSRRFFVHIPASYDLVDGVDEQIPLIFAFHGGGQTPEAMIAGKWGDDYFDQDYAFVIPAAETDPCNNPGGAGESRWMQPGLAERTSPADPNCDPASEVFSGGGVAMTFWNSSLTGSFTDVLFVEQLRAMVLARFPKLNPDKVYATGFSSGGGMTFALACYRRKLFAGFSVVAKVLGGDSARGDYDGDGIIETDPLSMVATCGKNELDPDHATGIAQPHLWGRGDIPSPFGGPLLDVQVGTPVALFAGDQDYTMQEINDTGAFVREKNNLNGTFWLIDPYQDTQADEATTQRRTFVTPLDAARPSETFRRFLVQDTDPATYNSATHAMPDADECMRPPGFFSTCDSNYTNDSISFWQDHADLNLNP